MLLPRATEYSALPDVEPKDILIDGRNANQFDAAAARNFGRYNVSVTAVACDLTSDAGSDALLQACPEPDILMISPI